MNWYPVGKNGANKTYSSKAACEAAEGQTCYDITGKDLRYHSLQTIPALDGQGNPLYQQGAPILDGQGNPVLDEDGQPTYEQGEQVMQTVLAENAETKASVLAADASKTSSENSIAQKLKNMDFGKRVIAIISVRNEAKSLTTGQVATLVSTYAAVQSLLMSGSIITAKAQIEAITPDGTVVTQADKDAILAEINAYLGV